MSDIPTDPDSIRALAAIMAETGLTEIEMSNSGSRIRVVRGGVVAPMASPVSAAVARPAKAAASAAWSENEATDHPGAVTSPMVGVAYLSPEPGAPVFVSVGQQVSEGQVLLLIEAMKTFNQIKSPRAGVLTRILVQNSAPVEYGEALMIVE